MVGVRRLTVRILARRRRLRSPRNAAWSLFAAAGSFARVCETTGQPSLALPIAFTTLPAKEGCRSPKKLTARPSGRISVMTRTSLGLASFSGFTTAPSSFSAWKYWPSTLKFSPSSRASTVLGRVPAATSTARAGIEDSAPSAFLKWMRSAWPVASWSMRVGVRPSVKRMPSSIAFSTSSWFSV